MFSKRINGKCQLIVSPTKLYLDTNHLINLSRIRRNEKLPNGQSCESYKFIDKLIKNHYGLIFNTSSPLEWVDGNATVASATIIAGILDSAKLLYMSEMDTFIYTHEILKEIKRIKPELNIPEYNVLNVFNPNHTFKPAFSLLANHVPNYFENIILPSEFPEEIPFATARDYALETFKWRQKKEETFLQRVVHFRESLLEDIDNADEYFKDPDRHHRNWVKSFLKIDLILNAYNSLQKGTVDFLTDKINFNNCPATKLYFQVRDIRIKNRKPPDDNDVDDWMYISILPYADISIIERKMKNLILQADNSYINRVFHDPDKAVEAIKNL